MTSSILIAIFFRRLVILKFFIKKLLKQACFEHLKDTEIKALHQILKIHTKELRFEMRVKLFQAFSIHVL